MYLEIQEKESVNPHQLSDEWDSYYFVKESGSANQSKENGVETDALDSKEAMLIKSNVYKVTKVISGIDFKKNAHPQHPNRLNDDTNKIQDEMDVKMNLWMQLLMNPKMLQLLFKRKMVFLK